MSVLRLPYPTLDTGSNQLVADPEYLNANFDAVARLVNGRLGLENCAPGGLFSPGNTANPRAFMSVCVQFDSSTYAALPALAQIFKSTANTLIPPTLDACAVSGASSAFAATLKRTGGGTIVMMTLVSPQTPALSDFIITNLASTGLDGVINSTQTLCLDVTAGTLQSLTLFLSTPHSPPPGI